MFALVSNCPQQVQAADSLLGYHIDYWRVWERCWVPKSGTIRSWTPRSYISQSSCRVRQGAEALRCCWILWKCRKRCGQPWLVAREWRNRCWATAYVQVSNHGAYTDTGIVAHNSMMCCSLENDNASVYSGGILTFSLARISTTFGNSTKCQCRTINRACRSPLASLVLKGGRRN